MLAGAEMGEQGGLQTDVGAGGVLRRQVGLRGAFAAHRPLHHDKVPQRDLMLQGAGGADPNEGAGARLHQLLQRDDGGGAADTGAAHRNG